MPFIVDRATRCSNPHLQLRLCRSPSSRSPSRRNRPRPLALARSPTGRNHLCRSCATTAASVAASRVASRRRCPAGGSVTTTASARQRPLSTMRPVSAAPRDSFITAATPQETEITRAAPAPTNPAPAPATRRPPGGPVLAPSRSSCPVYCATGRSRDASPSARPAMLGTPLRDVGAIPPLSLVSSTPGSACSATRATLKRDCSIPSPRNFEGLVVSEAQGGVGSFNTKNGSTCVALVVAFKTQGTGRGGVFIYLTRRKFEVRATVGSTIMRVRACSFIHR